ncbi:MAG: type II toxin-antitoxin system ParD family antitoxin [Algicola sp.]|nr:type II toxin-antitoxin system ParD family antitoxin [Algicola sp.]
MPTMNISLPEPMRAWVQTQIDDGKYAGNSDYVRDLIRKDQEQKNKIQAMQTAITKGLESGAPQNFDKETFKQRMLDSLENDGL